MPDWSYQTVFRPLLFRMSPKAGRDLALGCLGALSRLPLGPTVIDFMGHMHPDSRLQHTVGGITFATRVGLGASIDPSLAAPRALTRFGAGFLEVGPITLAPTPGGLIERNLSAESLTFHAPYESPGLSTVVQCLKGIPNVPILVRLSEERLDEQFESETITIFERLGSRPIGYIFQTSHLTLGVDTLKRLSETARSVCSGLLFMAVPATGSTSPNLDSIQSLIATGVIDGISIEGRGGIPGKSDLTGKTWFASTLEAVRFWRDTLPPRTPIIASGGIHEPIQAIDLIQAGSDLVRIDSGLIFSGPGLVKRVNEALLFQLPAQTEAPIRPERLSWFWTCLIAIGMLVGGILALIIATTRVVMPYDEAMAGLSRDEILKINENLLHFMAHDRVTLAGTMLAVGILYFALSVFGMRFGMHWAQRAIIVSASAGFFSFFLFLGFGYFDPFHAFVTAILFQLLIMAIHCELPRYSNHVAPDLVNDRAWYLSQWGQLLFIIHGAVLVVAGCVIAAVGITSVFVPEDLEFMQTTADHLFGAHPRLVPLIAHDRATFGGMLIATGVCVLLSSLWGFRRGHAWLWWALVTAGSAAYLATITIHWHVGYDSLKHLLPAYLGFAAIILGGAFSWSHLTDRKSLPTSTTAPGP
jgi:dihydroorotate dehydrogenase